jgi:hypothetical protein
VLALFAATVGVDRPALPFAIHITAADVLAAIAASCALALPWRDTLRRAWAGGALGAALALVGWTAVSALSHGAGLPKALGALELAVVFGLAAALARDTAARDLLLRALVAGAAAACVVGLLVAGLALAGVEVPGLYTGAGELGLRWRPAGVCRSGMLASWSLAPLVLVWLGGGRLTGRWRTPLLVLFTVTLALTLTRSAIALVFAVVLARAPRRLRPIACALCAAAAIASMYLDVHGRAEAGIRWRIAASAASRAAAHPIAGAGPASRAALAGWPSAADPPLAWDAHCAPLDVAATLGLPGLALFLAAVALALRRSLRARRDDLQHALLIGVAALLFDGMTNDIADFRHLWLLLGVACAPDPA